MQQFRSAFSLPSLLPLSVLTAQTTHGPVEVSPAVQHDVSRPLSSMASLSPGAENRREKPLRLIPQNQVVNNGPDAAVQTSPGPLVNTTPGLNFPGVGK